MKLYQELATLIDARARAHDLGMMDWAIKYSDRIHELVQNNLPSGSGIDSGTDIDLVLSHANLIMLHCSYHHMNEVGFYDGYTDHRIRVKPSLIHGFELRILGRNRNDIKDYLHEVYDHALRQEV